MKTVITQFLAEKLFYEVGMATTFARLDAIRAQLRLIIDHDEHQELLRQIDLRRAQIFEEAMAVQNSEGN